MLELELELEHRQVLGLELGHRQELELGHRLELERRLELVRGIPPCGA